MQPADPIDGLRKTQSVTQKKLRKRLRRQVGQAIGDYAMIEANDRVMVCLSGGKDSYSMLDVLLDLQAAAPVPFTLEAVNLDQKQPHFPAQVLPDYCRERGVTLHVLEQDTYSVVKRVVPEGRTLCGLCSRLRRGALYRFAREQGFTKIALGHHRDDILETLLMNMFNGGRLAAMPPKLLSEDGECTVIRPLAYCEERDLARFAVLQAYPIIPCRLCGSQENSQRRSVKALLREWERDHPGRIASMFRSLQHVVPSHLMDAEHFDFQGLRSANAPQAQSAPADAKGWLLPPKAQEAPATWQGEKAASPSNAGSGVASNAVGMGASSCE